MLELHIPGGELYNSQTREFTKVQPQTIILEHSLISLHRWESKWHKPFISDAKMTLEETVDYIRCMTVTKNVDPRIYSFLNDSHIEQVNQYIGDPMTATTITDRRQSRNKSTFVTAELIYYWMFSFQIPYECRTWHLNQLLTLIRVFDAKSQPDKKLSKRDTARSYAQLNAQRRKAMNSKG